MKNLVKDASMGPLREALQRGVEITKLSKEDMRPVMLKVLFKYKYWGPQNQRLLAI
jgi:hypothetical protein